MIRANDPTIRVIDWNGIDIRQVRYNIITASSNNRQIIT